MRYTQYTEVDKVLQSFLDNIRRIYRERLVGVYLYGSLVSGDFDLDSSDIDLMIVTSFRITAKDLAVLRRMHDSLARDNPDWDNRIDVVYLSAKAIKEFRTEKGPVVISSGEPLHIREGEPLKDWLQNWYIVRENSKTLFGLPPKSVIPPITREECAEAIRRYAAEINERVKHSLNQKGQAYAILTMCRVLCFLKTGEQASKKQAALWAQQQLPEWSGIIQKAVAWRQEQREESTDNTATLPETTRFVNFVYNLALSKR